VAGSWWLRHSSILSSMNIKSEGVSEADALQRAISADRGVTVCLRLWMRSRFPKGKCRPSQAWHWQVAPGKVNLPKVEPSLVHKPTQLRLDPSSVMLRKEKKTMFIRIAGDIPAAGLRWKGLTLPTSTLRLAILHSLRYSRHGSLTTSK
jgi:hypothetical protein